ncbi:protein-L-isoaspartate O-methyltransferase [Rhodomicrobium vannielii ATCC 17100]|uniref:Protein-L-isoaspartate O-methyltransferase n=1 Tax=Rhodomicrobium vannielii (strain ATCC 17100 / DSM 162 / LMG 4299 / NCIMB 10020 / ATH 3.1.1) TaxID=648757 RepID=E3I745_RHOVT|nr:protein-L-isoaspartate(D-aspartate) O-methyltransferase [Rhodomicrobium vannielii]ADP69610.1 protein-L-isoaspartate O-methyltransferase [Rhodomicrobium vannielii ATCC 17100]
MMDERLESLIHLLQRNAIADPRVLATMKDIPRKAFIESPELKPLAYADEALPIECGQTISQPYIVAYMTERLNVQRKHDVLEIGTGSGYQTAILSRLARHVYTIEIHEELHRLAVARFKALGLTNITALCGDGSKGWPVPRLFDRILVTAGVIAAPPDLIGQLGPCGAMVIPLGRTSSQRIMLVVRNGNGVEFQSLIPVRFVPLL